MAEPSPLLVQLPQVASLSGGGARPSSVEPVSTSCWVPTKKRPGMCRPFSAKEFSRLILLLECKSSTLAAIWTPLTLTQGPLPILSRAFTAVAPPVACSLRYACQVLEPAPTLAAKSWQCLSAPARPPKSAPLGPPTLLTKNVTLGYSDGSGCACNPPVRTKGASAATAKATTASFMDFSPLVLIDLA